MSTAKELQQTTEVTLAATRILVEKLLEDEIQLLTSTIDSLTQERDKLQKLKETYENNKNS